MARNDFLHRPFRETGENGATSIPPFYSLFIIVVLKCVSCIGVSSLIAYTALHFPEYPA